MWDVAGVEEMHVIIDNHKLEGRCIIRSVICTSLNSKSTEIVSCSNSISIKQIETLSVYTQTKHNNYKYEIHISLLDLLRLGTLEPPDKINTIL